MLLLSYRDFLTCQYPFLDSNSEPVCCSCFWNFLQLSVAFSLHLYPSTNYIWSCLTSLLRQGNMLPILNSLNRACTISKWMFSDTNKYVAPHILSIMTFFPYFKHFPLYWKKRHFQVNGILEMKVKSHNGVLPQDTIFISWYIT